MSICENCVRGCTYEGPSSGTWEIINEVNCYVATPSENYPIEKAILLFPDLYGPKLINCQLLADDFAAHGFKTIVPDYYDGDGAPLEALDPAFTFDHSEWLKRHGQEVTRPLVDKVVEGLKATGVTSFGITGYCIGARYAFDLAFDGIAQVIAVSHPSLLKIPEDLETYYNKSSAPLLINSCTFDQMFDHEAQVKADEIFKDRFLPGYRHEHWKNCAHGFASRGDPSIPDVKVGKEGAFKATVEWMRKYLYA